MIHRTKQEKLFLVLVPVCAQAAEDSCAVIEGVGQDPNFSLTIGNDATFEKSVLGKGHDVFLLDS